MQLLLMLLNTSNGTKKSQLFFFEKGEDDVMHVQCPFKYVKSFTLTQGLQNSNFQSNTCFLH